MDIVQVTKAKLQKEGIFWSSILTRNILLVKKLEIEETKTIWYSIFKTNIIKVGLVFSISNFFIDKFIRQIIGVSFSCSNSALGLYYTDFGTSYT